MKQFRLCSVVPHLGHPQYVKNQYFGGPYSPILPMYCHPKPDVTIMRKDVRNMATYFLFYENLFLIAIGCVPLLRKIRTDLGSPIVKKITCFALPASHNLREPNSEYLHVELMWLGNLLAKNSFLWTWGNK